MFQQDCQLLGNPEFPRIDKGRFTRLEIMSNESSYADERDLNRIGGLDYASLSSLVEVDEVSKDDLLSNNCLDIWPTLQPQAD